MGICLRIRLRHGSAKPAPLDLRRKRFDTAAMTGGGVGGRRDYGTKGRKTGACGVARAGTNQVSAEFGLRPRHALWSLAAAVAMVGGCTTPAGGSASSQTLAVEADRSASEPAQAPATPTDPVVARVEGVTITESQLVRPLIESHGLTTLLNLVQLEMARADAARGGLTISPSDVQAEEARTLKRMFDESNVQGGNRQIDPSEYARLLEQFLQRRNMSRVEWNMLMQTNATLRKLAEPKSRGRIADEQLTEAFRQLYGEKVQVQHIQCGNLQEIAEAQRRLAGGEAFEDVAKAVSRNARTAPLGGELPSFTRQSAFPPAFKDAAFALQPGQVSDPVMADNAYHLIRLVRKIEPSVIKFEDVKGGLREDLEEKLTQQIVQELRADLSSRAQRALSINDPVLRQQFQAEEDRRQKQIRDRAEIRKELERERERTATEQAIPDLPPAPGETRPGPKQP
jgi:parvulin-like peptidyl-prolyl isomerase